MMTTEMMINEMMTAIEAMDPEILAGGLLFVAGIFAAIFVLGVIRYLLTAIGYSKMYRKAGKAPWKAFIPVYNTYNNYKISWNGKMFFLSAALYILMTAFSNSAMLALQLAAAAAGIALIVVMVKQNVKMAKLFGKGNGTGIALMFFPGITSLILGLGKSEFQAEMIENN
jgi:hypothetical protein